MLQKLYKKRKKKPQRDKTNKTKLGKKCWQIIKGLKQNYWKEFTRPLKMYENGFFFLKKN